MAVVLVMMVIITGIVYSQVRKYMFGEAEERYEGVLQRDHEEFRRRLSDVMVAIRNNHHDIEREVEDPEKVISQMERILEVNPTIISCGVLYVADYFPGRGRCLELYAARDSIGQVHVSRIENDDNIYLQRDWFKEGIEKDTTQWSKLYYEDDLIPNVTGRRLLTTYTIPVHNKQGKVVALFGGDLPLEYLRYEIMDDLQEKIKLFEKGSKHHSFNFVIDDDGTYIIHPDKKRILHANFFEEAKQTSNKIDDDVMASMMKGEKGSALVEIDGVPSWIYYRTVKHMDWVIGIVVPEEIIFHNGRMLNTIILAVVLVGLIAVYFICERMIKDTTSPVTREKAALESELKIAHGIQMALLPKTFPPFPERSDIDLYAYITPAREVGGDLYDYFLRGDRLVFCIGDVSGKGVPAALLMAVMRAMFRSEARRCESASGLVNTMNHNLSYEYTAGYFVTMFVGILDLNTGHLDFCNAGHEPPLVSGERLDVIRNLPVGALAEWDYQGQETMLKSGDTFFLFTDGLTEAQDAEGKMFGRQRVIDFVGSHLDSTPQQLTEQIENEVQQFVGDTEQSDDLTMLILKWQKPDDSHYHLSICADMDDIEQMDPFIANASQQAGLTTKEGKQIRLALEEAVANVINYSQATYVNFDAYIGDGCLKVTITDDGIAFDATAGSPTDFSLRPDERPAGGLGIMLLHQMTDDLSYQRMENRNVLTLIKKIINE